MAFVKLIYSIKTNMITSILSKFLFRFLKNSIKYVVSRGVAVALKVESFASYDYSKYIHRLFLQMKVKMNMQLNVDRLGKNFAKYCV